MPEGKRALRHAFKTLELAVPETVSRGIRSLRHPRARWVRIPVGILAVIGGVFSFLPVLGIWMLPLGLLLIACDVPVLQKPVARFTLWGLRRWSALRAFTGARPGEAWRKGA